MLAGKVLLIQACHQQSDVVWTSKNFVPLTSEMWWYDHIINQKL